MSISIITLTTDFGHHDPYVGIVKGVILGICPSARIVDLTHQVPAQDITHAAWTLKDSVPFFPKATVHMAVVDPDVGTGRRGIAISSQGHFFVGPDNGIFSAFVPPEKAVVLNRPEMFLSPVSTTFHARDIFAPAAARLASGQPMSELGDKIADPMVIPLPEPIKEGRVIKGQVVQADRFGNLVTNIPHTMLSSDSVKLRIKDREIKGLYRTYRDIPAREPAVIVGSSQRLEISVKNGSAKEVLKANINDPVTVT